MKLYPKTNNTWYITKSTNDGVFIHFETGMLSIPWLFKRRYYAVIVDAKLRITRRNKQRRTYDWETIHKMIPSLNKLQSVPDELAKETKVGYETVFKGSRVIMHVNHM